MAPKKKKKRGDDPPSFSSDCKCLLHQQWSTQDKRAYSILKIQPCNHIENETSNGRKNSDASRARRHALCRTCYDTFRSKVAFQSASEKEEGSVEISNAANDHESDSEKSEEITDDDDEPPIPPRMTFTEQMTATINNLISLIDEANRDELTAVEMNMKRLLDLYYNRVCSRYAVNDTITRTLSVLKEADDKVLATIENQHIWDDITYLIGERLCRGSVYKDGMELMNCYKDKSFYINLDLDEFIKNRNRLVFMFLSGISGNLHFFL